MNTITSWVTGVLLLLAGVVSAQTPEYFMSDTTVTDCDGFLYDSGGPDDSYSNNENLTFTVDTGGESIVVTFLSEICIETGFDFLYIYDGTDTNAPLLATITGTGFTPSAVTATSGAVTFHFTSDPSASYCGFEIFWDTIVGPPEPPILIAEPPQCGNSFFTVEFSYPIECDWLTADSVTVVGNGPLSVVSAALNCQGGTGTFATIDLAEPIDYNCDFQVFIQMGIPDVCDSIWVYTLITDFTVDLCPVNGGITATETEFCEGGCTDLTAFVVGCNDHTFVWNEGLPADEGPHTVCPTTTTTYEVTVTETATGNSTTEVITITVIESQILLSDTTVCRTEDLFQIPSLGTATGLWDGPGIIDFEAGVFHPDSALIGENVVYFLAGGLCTDSIIVTVLPIDAGGLTAACPGTDPFQLEAEPPGGTWTGPFVSLEGIFDPYTEGSFTLTYTAGTCQDTLQINVADIAGLFTLDTLCQSNWADTIPFSPLGGLWSGPGIIDSLYGVFDPGEVPEGAYALLYEIQGCSQIFDVYVKGIFVGARTRSSCPEQAPFIPQPNFSPPGGFWEGQGIIDQQTGMYDPGSIPNDFWTSLIYYAPNGCTDTIFYYNRQTVVPVDTMWWCTDQEGTILNNETTGRSPFGGSWSGQGVFNFENAYYFIPAAAGTGQHTLTYTANGCADILVMVVHPATFEVGPYGFCSSHEGQVLNPGLLTGGSWTGNGITNASTGYFDPSMASPGPTEVLWNTPAGCFASVSVVVETFLQASISGLTDTYCFENSNVPVMVSPAGGVLTGTTSEAIFNPALAGTGTHTIAYAWQGEYCMSSAEVDVFVFPSLVIELTASASIICQGGGSLITGEAAGGGEVDFFTYIWSDGLFPVNSHTVSPPFSQWYYLTIDDGCSDQVTDSVFIEVLPPIQTAVMTSDTLCFGAEGAFADVSVLSAGSFSTAWSGAGSESGTTMTTTAGAILSLSVTDDVYGCAFDTLVLVPSYSPVTALFSPNPNEDCIPWASQPIELIDFSQNGLSGFWDLGTGQTSAYIPGEQVFTSFDQAGEYTVSLVIFNEGDCPASFEMGLCVLPATPIFIPDIFSPNDDGLNDMLYVRGPGIVDMTFMVYDRWGERVFTSHHPDHGWDGRFRGRDMPSGSYPWLLQVRLNDGSSRELRGNVKLVR